MSGEGCILVAEVIWFPETIGYWDNGGQVMGVVEGYRACSCSCAATYLDHDICGPRSLFTGVKGVTGIEGWNQGLPPSYIRST